MIKQRVARTGEGKSSGSRSIILFQLDHRAIYVYGFEKKDRANIKSDELEAFRYLAKVILGYSEAEIAQRVEDGSLIEVNEAEEHGDG